MSGLDCRSVTLTKSDVIDMISSEKDLFFRYKQICNSYDVSPDPVVEKIHRDRINSLNYLISIMKADKK